nr:Chain B, Protein AMBP [Homo sapiens]
QEPEGSGGGQG